MKHYLAHIVEVNGEYEYGANFLIATGEGDPLEFAREVALDWRGGGEWSEDCEDFAWNDDGMTAIKFRGLDKISEEEFDILRKHMVSFTG